MVENAATVNFYRNMALGAASFYAVLTAALYYDSLTTGIIVSQQNCHIILINAHTAKSASNAAVSIQTSQLCLCILCTYIVYWDTLIVIMRTVNSIH